jgi:hypothetical protein
MVNDGVAAGNRMGALTKGIRVLLREKKEKRKRQKFTKEGRCVR